MMTSTTIMETVIIKSGSTPMTMIIMKTTNPLFIATARAKPTFRPSVSPLPSESPCAESGLF